MLILDSLIDTNSAYITANVMKSNAFDGVEELLIGLGELGLKLAILTSRGSNIVSVLEQHKWSNYFSSVVHHGRITKPKPDAEGFLLAAAECGVEPAEAVMVGDTVVDIETGKNAGAISTIGLTHGFGLRKDLISAGTDYIVDDLFAIKPIIQKLMETPR